MLSGNRIEDEIDVVDTDTLTAGIDVPCDKRRLVSASSLEWVLDANTKTIHRWAASGLMPIPYRIGKSLRWDADELRDWIANGCQAVAGIGTSRDHMKGV